MSSFVYFDLQNGISGDMTLGALLDAGVDIKAIRKRLRKLPAPGWRLEAEATIRNGVAATRAKVLLAKNAPLPHRHLSHILEIIDAAALPPRSAARAKTAFSLLAAAEASVHQTTIEKVHFHEVGALDAIVDIVGSMVGFELLGAERFAASTVVTGFGEIQCDHGTLPVPAPATARLLEGAPVEAGPTAMEMTTPTGAAILRALAPAFVPLPPMRLEKTAFGAGGREIPGRTNCLRLLIGEPLEGADNQAGLESARMCLLTTEIDDMNPELYGPLLDRLFAAKARDASLVPIVMKKGRPGVSVRVLCDETRRGALLEILLRHTTTFGVKTAWVERHCLRREVKEMATPYGPIRVKIGYWGDQAIKAAPEFEDCRRAAETTGAPIGDVYRSAERSYENARDEA